MIKTILVDDEFYIRERLKIIVPWEELGFRLMGEAENGAEALALVERVRPQFVLADIKIPIMDGLALAKEIHQRFPETIVVFLSGYDTFEYAQQALRYGVAGYLLKPIKRTELLELLEQVKAKLAAQAKGKRAFAVAEAALADDALHHMIFETTPFPQPLENGRARLRAALDGRGAVVALFRLPDAYVGHSIRLQLCELLESRFPEGASFVFHATDTTAGLCLCFDGGAFSMTAMEELYGDLRESLLSPPHLAVSDLFSAEEDIAEAYRQAEFALRESIFFAWGAVSYREALLGHSGEAMPLSSLRGELLLELRSRRPEKAKALLRRELALLLERYRSYTNLSLLTYEIFSTVNIYGSDLFRHGTHDLHIQKLLEGFSSYGELGEWLMSFLDTPSHGNEKDKVSAQYHTVRQAREIADAHYHVPDCSLEYIALRLGLTANYVSGLFKKIMGISVVQYITNCRMEEAKRLLQEQYSNLTDVCEKVGYKDVFYFSKRFKQYYGISPSGFSAIKKEGAEELRMLP